MTMVAIGKFDDGAVLISDSRASSSSLRNDSLQKILPIGKVRVFCSEYEVSGRWEGKGHFQIVKDFKEFIEKSVEIELDRYKDGRKHAIGFLLGGKTPLDSKYKVHEIHWLLESGEVKFSLGKHEFFIITGDSKVCLDAYLSNHPELLTDRYWKGFKLDEAKNMLVKLFNLAVDEKRKLNNDEFSDDYDLDLIEE